MGCGKLPQQMADARALSVGKRDLGRSSIKQMKRCCINLLCFPRLYHVSCLQATLSDGTAGGVESGSLTVEVCGLVDEWVAVKEEDIARAMMGALNHDGKASMGWGW